MSEEITRLRRNATARESVLRRRVDALRESERECDRLKSRAALVERLAADVAHLLIAHRGMGADDARRLLGLLGVDR